MQLPPWSRRPAYLLPLVLASGALLRLASLWTGVERARAFAARGRPFERRLSASGPRVLILGDSTGVGIGASRPEESIAGLIAADFPDADIVNVSASGARVADAVAQASKCVALGWRFDLALLHVGGNDILRATPVDRLAAACEALAAELPRVAEGTVWLGPANIGQVPLFPPPFSWWYAVRSRAAIAVFADCAARHEFAFVDFAAAEHKARFADSPRRHFADDGLHPNSSSYSYGYGHARRAIDPVFKRARTGTDGPVAA